VEFIAILIVITAGAAVLVGRRIWLDRRDAEQTEVTGGEWHFRSELPLDPGPPYNYFGADLVLLRPFDIMEGTDEGFAVAYFTIVERRSSSANVERPAAIVDVSVELPNFTCLSEDLDGSAPARLASLQQYTPPHYDTGRPGRLGRRSADVLSRARSMKVTTAPFAILVTSKGARSEDVQRLALALAKALVADARASSTPP
jgi:hypothetical protein